MPHCDGGGCGELPDPQDESNDFNDEIMAFAIPCPRCDNPITILKKVHLGESAFGYILQCDHGTDSTDVNIKNGCGAESVLFGVEIEGEAPNMPSSEEEEEEEEEKEEKEKPEEDDDPLADLKRIVKAVWAKGVPFKVKKEKKLTRYIYGMS